MQALAELFKALSDETRLHILAMLQSHGELCVCDVEGALGISQSKSSRHLRYLYNAGLVQNRRAGTWVHYRLPDEPGPAQARILGALDDLIATTDRQALETRLRRWFERKSNQLTCCSDPQEA